MGVAGHGGPRTLLDRVLPITPSALKELIVDLPNYSPDAPIYLYACETGQGENSYAEQLKNLMPNPVIAPEVLIDGDTKGIVLPDPATWRQFK